MPITLRNILIILLAIILGQGSVSAAAGKDKDPAKKELKNAIKAYDKKKYNESFPVFSRLAAEGNLQATGYAAVSHELGHGTPVDTAEAIRLYEICLKNNQAWWANRYGNMMLRSGNYDKARECFTVTVRRASSQNYAAEAAFKLASMARDNLFESPVDEDEIVRWLRMAARQAHNRTIVSRAREILAEMGESIYAMEEFNKRINTFAHSGKDLFDKALKYYNGDLITEPNLPQAFNYFKAAASIGYYEAYDYLAALYRNPDLPIYSHDRANQIYINLRDSILTLVNKKRAKGPDLYTIGRIYRDGLGIDSDKYEAIHFFRLGAEKGDLNCQLDLGQLLDEIGQYNEALFWLEEAGCHGQDQAAFLAAGIYEKGRNGPGPNHIDINTERAIELYRCAVEAKGPRSKDATKALRRLGAPRQGPYSKVNSRTKPAPASRQQSR